MYVNRRMNQACPVDAKYLWRMHPFISCEELAVINTKIKKGEPFLLTLGLEPDCFTMQNAISRPEPWGGWISSP
jgi:hypothetical protein